MKQAFGPKHMYDSVMPYLQSTFSCPQFPALPTGCQLVKVPNKCCKQVQCSNGVFIGSGIGTGTGNGNGGNVGGGGIFTGNGIIMPAPTGTAVGPNGNGNTGGSGNGGNVLPKLGISNECFQPCNTFGIAHKAE